ncbi:MAG: hypothetical protein IBX40_13185 [Methanosarcinales archaeon]|nr:hypothetical protein [Methanosarcinales archaeon]
METEVEKRGIGKLQVGLAVCIIVVVILASFNIWLFTDLQNQRNLNNNLQIQKDTLQNQLSLLNTTYKNYISTHRHSDSEYDSLQSEYDNYMANHHHTDLQYNSYVTNHQYTNSEYDEAFFFFYYVKPEEQKFGVYDLEDELSGLEWLHPYQAGVFDCSEMSAFLEWHLENEGWHTKIVAGDSPFGSGRHAWLLVETSEGKYMPVEATSVRVVWWSDPNFDNYWIYDHKFETIQEAIDYYESEFDWWKSP